MNKLMEDYLYDLQSSKVNYLNEAPQWLVNLRKQLRIPFYSLRSWKIIHKTVNDVLTPTAEREYAKCRKLKKGRVECLRESRRVSGRAYAVELRRRMGMCGDSQKCRKDLQNEINIVSNPSNVW